MTITTIGLDIAKNVFQVHGVGGNGRVIVRRQLRRTQVLEFFGKLSHGIGRPLVMADAARMDAPSTATMGVDEILLEFTYADWLPEGALGAATKQRARLTPIFIKEIEAYLDLKDDERLEANPLFFIFHLFGEWRENSAYRPLARLLRCPTVDIETVFCNGPLVVKHQSVERRCRALSSCPWSTLGSPTSCDPIQSGGQSWDTWSASSWRPTTRLTALPDHASQQGPSGTSALGACSRTQ